MKVEDTSNTCCDMMRSSHIVKKWMLEFAVFYYKFAHVYAHTCTHIHVTFPDQRFSVGILHNKEIPWNSRAWIRIWARMSYQNNRLSIECLWSLASKQNLINYSHFTKVRINNLPFWNSFLCNWGEDSLEDSRDLGPWNKFQYIIT